ncbi:potassium channel family protein [Haloimpatiens sp. FM7330]|uniref:potassium channel family protein n=1 Tax=Haloimpatiens sp. FM7330 TaxID=3298610 RepID=UPI003637AF9A
MNKKQFIIIGLGRFGTSVAETLYNLGHDVLAVDSDEDVVQSIANRVTHAVQADVTDENNLKAIGVQNFDVAVISIGSKMQASIMATLLAKELGVKHIIAKANNKLHAKVLYKIGADKVVFPERDMGVRVAHNLVSSNILDYIELSSEYSIAEIASPKDWHGKNLKQIDVRSTYGINVMAIKKPSYIDIAPSAEEVIEEGDVIVAIGSIEDLNRLENTIR